MILFSRRTHARHRRPVVVDAVPTTYQTTGREVSWLDVVPAPFGRYLPAHRADGVLL